MSLVKNLAHILVTGPLFLYVGLARPSYKWVYKVLMALGVILACYFIYLLFALKRGPYHVWLVIHLVLIFPLLIWVGYRGRSAPDIAFSLLMTIGIAAIGYHLVRILQHA